MKTVKLGAGMAFWGNSVRPAIEMVERADIDYLCCDHLAELTMSILSKQQQKDPAFGYTRDVLDLLRGALPTCLDKGIKVVTNAGGANPRACAERVVVLAKELGLSPVRVAVVTGDDIRADIDRLMDLGVPFTNMDTGEDLASVRDRLTHASVYTGCEGIVEALKAGADVVVCGRVTDIALYLGPLIHEFGWAPDDWPRLGMAAAVAHAVECGGQATGGLYAGGWQDVPGLETLGYPIAEVADDGTAVITKTPGSGGRVDIGTVSEQMVYEILDPGNYLTADVTADFTGLTLTDAGPEPGPHRRRDRPPAAGHPQGQHGLPGRLRRRGGVHLHLAGRLRQGPARAGLPPRAAPAGRVQPRSRDRRVPRPQLDVGQPGTGPG